MHRTKSINLKDIIGNSLVAFAAAWIVYNALTISGNGQYATLSSVLCGRFADDILQMGWKWFKAIVFQTNKDIK